MARKPNDEKIIAALLTNGTIRDAAKVLRISESHIYERLRTEDFVKAYDRARDDVLRGCVYKMTEHVGSAVDVIANIMLDAGVNPAVRVNAAKTILEYSGRMADRWNEREVVIRQENKPESMLDALTRALYEEAVSRSEMQKFEEEATNL